MFLKQLNELKKIYKEYIKQFPPEENNKHEVELRFSEIYIIPNIFDEYFEKHKDKIIRDEVVYLKTNISNSSIIRKITQEDNVFYEKKTQVSKIKDVDNVVNMFYNIEQEIFKNNKIIYSIKSKIFTRNRKRIVQKKKYGITYFLTLINNSKRELEVEIDFSVNQDINFINDKIMEFRNKYIIEDSKIKFMNVISNWYKEKDIVLTKPTIFDYEILNNDKFYITNKLDGVRCNLIIVINKIYKKYNDGSFYYICDNELDLLNGTILDVEEFKNKFYIFDVLFYCNKDLRQEPFNIRYDFMKDAIEKFSNKNKLFNLKEFVYVSNFKIFKDYLFKIKPQLDNRESDGFIMNKYNSIYQEQPYKWKTIPTIDLLVMDGKVKYNHYSEKVMLKADLPNNISEYDGQIVEFSISRKENIELKIIRTREDKLEPNSRKVVKETIEAATNKNINYDDLCGNTNYYLSYHINIFKYNIIKNLSNRVFVVNFGTGSDFVFYSQNYKITKFYGIEANSDKFKKAEKNQKNMKKFEIINSNIENCIFFNKKNCLFNNVCLFLILDKMEEKDIKLLFTKLKNNINTETNIHIIHKITEINKLKFLNQIFDDEELICIHEEELYKSNYFLPQKYIKELKNYKYLIYNQSF